MRFANSRTPARISKSLSPSYRGRILTIACCLLAVALAHWWTPTSPHTMHAVHVVLRKLFVLPVVLAAAWFSLRGTVAVAALITLFYLPHVVLQWTGNLQENINQYGELATVWITALIAGSLMGREKAALQEVARTHEGSLVALVSALDAREHDTELHSLRVRDYAVRIGRALGMGGKELGILRQGALLHDIGKIGIPDDILLKEGPLTDSEWLLMQEHPEIGRRILESVLFLAEAAKIVYAHQEKYDGSGYPRGLAGDEIPLAARVFAIADTFDALTNDRPYREAVDIDQAKKEIQAASGTHFDPRVVAAFLSVPNEEWERIADQVAVDSKVNATDFQPLTRSTFGAT
jgi:putative nucleotidyltransferase with HDIG domain